MPEAAPSERTVIAWVFGTVRNHVHPNPAEDSPRDVALAAVAELVRGRDDGPALLAEVAGVMLGTAEFDSGRAQAQRAADLLEAAGADQDLVAGWEAEGRRRAEQAAQAPFGARVV
jgi:hypothetical protein